MRAGNAVASARRLLRSSRGRVSANPLRWTALVLGTLLLATAIATLYTTHVQRDDQRRRIDRDATTTIAALDSRLDGYGDLLTALRGAVALEGDPSRSEYRRFVRSLRIGARYPGLQALSFGHVVGRRAILTRIEPRAGNERALGFDVLGDSARRRAFAASRASGRPAATAPVRLPQRPRGRRGLVLLLALSDHPGGPARGVVTAAFDMDHLIPSIVGERGDFDLELYDVGAASARHHASPSRANLVYGDARAPRAVRGAGGRDGVLRRLDVAGRRWAVYYRPRGTVAAPGPNHLIVAVGGTIGSLLAAWLFLTLARGRSLALASAGRMTRELELSERQTRQILETANDAFVSIDEHGAIGDWNPQAQATFGWSREQVLGRDLADTIVPAAQREAHRRGLERFLRTGEQRVLDRLIELTAVHHDGREFPVELTISPLRTERGYVFNAFVRDITERRRTQEQLALAHARAVEASQMKSDFVANTSHEIRTPLNGVIGLTELLLATDLDDEQHDYAESIRASGDALMAVISDILDFSKIEAGKLELDDHPFDLHEVVDGVSAMLGMEAHEKGLDLKVRVDDEVPRELRGDGARIRQVLANLATNAVKFTEAGEVVMRIALQPGGRDGLDGADGADGGDRAEGAVVLRFEVADTGIGIEPTTAERIFDSFSQADSSTTREYGGTGLGLAISKQLVELMGGAIGLRSAPRSGSTFWFTVPVALVAREQRAITSRRTDFAQIRVLIVDDDGTSRTSLERKLSSWGMGCDSTADDDEALRLLRTTAEAGLPYALALLDFEAGGASGLALARTLLAEPQLATTRLMMLISSSFQREAAVQLGVHGFVTKPLRGPRLAQEIARVLGAGQLVPLADAATRVSSSAGEAPNAGRPVLVAEDKSVNQLVAARMLQKLGFRVDIARNGREAVEMHSRGGYAAIFMDCQMPELDGYQATAAIRRREARGGRHTPIVAMTAHTLHGEGERCLAAGMDDYVAKPIRSADLGVVVARALGRDTRDPRANGDASPADPEPALIDHSRLAEVFGDDEQARTSLLAQFLIQSRARVAALAEPIDDGDAPAVARLAHGLKGSAAVVGAERISRLAAQLSDAAAAGQLDDARRLHGELRSALAATDDALAAPATSP